MSDFVYGAKWTLAQRLTEHAVLRVGTYDRLVPEHSGDDTTDQTREGVLRSEFMPADEVEQLTKSYIQLLQK